MNRDEDLLLFRDMHKRDKNEVASLLLPVSVEFEANGNYALYRMASGKKGQVGLDYLMTETGKNDYDWLKTPPATPLFPSLEMEDNAAELVIHKEIPIIEPLHLSRFAGATKTTSLRSASKPKGQVGKQSEKKDTRHAAASNQQNEKPITRRKQTNASNISKTREMESFLNKSRGVSPAAGRLKPLPGFSDEAPPNLRTDRSLSATRGRPNQSTNQRPGSSSSSSVTKPAIRRQSCSPSVSRGRKQDMDEGKGAKLQQGNATTQVLGSRMVDKLLNARKSVHQDKETKTKLNESSGFGRHISRISAPRHMEIHQDSRTSSKNGVTSERKSSNM